jgi:hypothetical protein
MTDILAWIEDCWFARLVQEVAWLFPAFETLHFMGLSLMLGALLMVDLRLVGYARFIPIKSALAFVPIIFIGFVINVITGLGFFCAAPFTYYPNVAFRWKMLLVLLAGLNAAWFWLKQQSRVLALAEGAEMVPDVKITAWLSLIFWTGVIVMGRMIAFYG